MGLLNSGGHRYQPGSGLDQAISLVWDCRGLMSPVNAYNSSTGEKHALVTTPTVYIPRVSATIRSTL